MTDFWNQGIIPPTPIQEAEIVEETKEELSPSISVNTSVSKQEVTEHKYRAVRGSGDPVYLIIDNKKHWVLTADVFKKLGFKLGEEEKVENSELATYLPGETITPENVNKYL